MTFSLYFMWLIYFIFLLVDDFTDSFSNSEHISFNSLEWLLTIGSEVVSFPGESTKASHLATAKEHPEGSSSPVEMGRSVMKWRWVSPQGPDVEAKTSCLNGRQRDFSMVSHINTTMIRLCWDIHWCNYTTNLNTQTKIHYNELLFVSDFNRSYR